VEHYHPSWWVTIAQQLHDLATEEIYNSASSGMHLLTGLDYWTDIFLAFTHVVVVLIDSCWLRPPGHHLNDEYEQ